MKKKVLIVVSDYYKDISDALLKSTKKYLNKKTSLKIIKVPGVFEIPVIISRNIKKFDGFIAIGCVIRGETTHYEIVSTESSRGLANLGLEKVCIGNAILTVENRLQAEKRADPKVFDKGGEACNALLSIIKIKRRGN